MNVLDKILEEIDNRKSYHEEKLYQQDDYEIQKMYCDEELDWITNIICSHMDELGCDERLVKKFVTNREVIRDFNDKPIYIKGCCPKCGYELKACETDYCKVCGQALNWDNPKGGL